MEGFPMRGLVQGTVLALAVLLLSGCVKDYVKSMEEKGDKYAADGQYMKAYDCYNSAYYSNVGNGDDQITYRLERKKNYCEEQQTRSVTGSQGPGIAAAAPKAPGASTGKSNDPSMDGIEVAR
jgi:hypothetical protein